MFAVPAGAEVLGGELRHSEEVTLNALGGISPAAMSCVATVDILEVNDAGGAILEVFESLDEALERIDTQGWFHPSRLIPEPRSLLVAWRRMLDGEEGDPLDGEGDGGPMAATELVADLPLTDGYVAGLSAASSRARPKAKGASRAGGAGAAQRSTRPASSRGSSAAGRSSMNEARSSRRGRARRPRRPRPGARHELC